MLGLIPSHAQANLVHVIFEDNKSRSTFYPVPGIEGDYVSLNHVIQAFNLKRTWDSLNGMIILSYRDKTAILTPDQPVVIVERRSYSLKNPPRYIEGILMIPLEYVTNILPLFYDKEIAWDPSRRTLKVGSHRIEITSIQHTVYHDYTRLIIQTNRPITYRLVEKLPSLLILDLPETSFRLTNNPLLVEGSNTIKNVKVINSYGITQVLINLGNQFINYNHFALDDPPRIVIDVYSAPIEERITQKDIEGPSSAESLNPFEVLPKARTQTTVRSVVIDPGHGGRDNGIAVGPDLWEKNITLTLAQKLAESLRRRLGIRVILTRTADENFSPVERTTLANSSKADLLISLHLNNSFSSSTDGFEVYTLDAVSDLNSTDPEALLIRTSVLEHAQESYLTRSERLADYIVTTYNKETKSEEARKKKAPLLILKGAIMPAVQIEIGYFSNVTDKEKITREEFQEFIVKVLTDGIISFKRYLEQVSLN